LTGEFAGKFAEIFIDSCDCPAAELVYRIYPHARLIDWSFAAAHDKVRVYSWQRPNPFARTAQEMLHRKLEPGRLVGRRLVCSKYKENPSD
jgi:hypothetical protein